MKSIFKFALAIILILNFTIIHIIAADKDESSAKSIVIASDVWENISNENKLKKTDYEFSTIKMLTLYIVFSENEQGKQFAKIWDEEFKKALISNSLSPIYKKWKNLTFAGLTK